MSLTTSESVQASSLLHILIIGGGLAGLASALALRQAGHRVTVFERMPEFYQVGAGIQLSPNGTRILRALGVLDSVLVKAYQPETGGLRSWHNGAFLSRALPAASAIRETYGEPYIVVHRADLLAALVSAATERGIDIKLGCNVAELDLSQETAVHLANGERIEGDIILGADGERSFCRDVLLGRPDLPKPTGDVAYRIAVSRRDIVEDANHVSREMMQHGSTNLWMGPNAHAVSYLLNNNDILNLVLIRKEGRQREGDIMYGPQRVSLEELQGAFDGWDPALRALLEVPGKSDCMKWNILQIQDLDSWRHEGGAKLCLIGDAAHGMPPYLAQGAVQAFEDAAVLGAIFEQVSDKAHIVEALKVFEAVRMPRVSKVKERTLSRMTMYNLCDGPEQLERDENLAKSSGYGSPDDLADPDFQKWLWGYDAAADGKRAWEQRSQYI